MKNTVDCQLHAEVGKVGRGIAFALDHGFTGGYADADVLGAGEAWDLLFVGQ